MKETDARFQAIVMAACECSPAGCLATDPAGEIVYANQSIERIFGYSRSELVGKHVEILVPDAKSHSHGRSRQRYFEHATARPMGGGAVLEGRRKDGMMIPVEIGLTPVVTEGELFAIGSVVDVSARLAAEQRAERSEHNFVQSQKLEALGNLAGGISHDFNNILQAILGYAELLKASSHTGAQSIGDLDAILEAAARGRDLVGRILGFTRDREGELQPLHLGILVEETHRMLKSILPSSVSLRIDTDPATPTVLADATQIHQIVMNLATNAVAAMPDGGALDIRVGPVHVTPERAQPLSGAREGLYGSIVVSDTGAGMSKEVKERVFEPFFTTKSEGRGTGFGLSLVHGIVTGLGGFVELSSERGVGTSVGVYLPAQLWNRRPSERPPPAPARYRALWVDDEPSLATLGQRSLAALGFEVSAHTSSLQALEEFKASPDVFDLVVSDNTMPHLSGLAFLHAVHSLRPEVPTLMVSGKGLGFCTDDLARNGVQRVLAKPFNLVELQAIVRELLPGLDCEEHSTC